MIYPAPFVTYCAAVELKLTSLRKSVLFILWESQKPLKAYEILDKLILTKQNATPPSVYRALDYFTEYGVVHKIESIQSYTLCHEPEKHLPSEILMVCNNCYQVQEVYNNAIHALAKQLANDNHFHLGQSTIEFKGFCDKCCIVLKQGAHKEE
ncbi:transcriptional repressor [Legionella hackeliae]|uniref:Putative Ferric uptake regulator, Fur family n=1 Tax=Legionella hackeliae TaxID=449 RepID=A0A0A8UXI1_LEGHA|nr:transcriptional repressor [Legionella hackeliae]KTD12425.1 transcriptional regulator np20, Fur family [Legionella hackeliae]CEK11837.1 putative Ferric uptake regulator, Fur family [Legionella hackeliae]STX48603.1 transcriptional regulator np20, Fur family [Legionella hackeliae]